MIQTSLATSRYLESLSHLRGPSRYAAARAVAAYPVKQDKITMAGPVQGRTLQQKRASGGNRRALKFLPAALRMS